jgi:hypothetical protein
VRHPTFLKISESYSSLKARETHPRIDERQIGEAQREPGTVLEIEAITVRTGNRAGAECCQLVMHDKGMTACM